MSPSIRLAVSAIVEHEDRYLLVRRGKEPDKGLWAFPGGGVEFGETTGAAAVRELKEETGLSGTIMKLIAVTRIEDRELYGDMLAVIYLVRVDEGEPVAGEEVEDVRFFERSELPEFYRTRYKDIIEQLDKGQL